MVKGLLGKRFNSVSGTTLVEFALTIPLLALLLFGIIQYGFIFAAYTTLRTGASAAARYATLSLPNPTVPQIQSYAKSAIGPMLLTNGVTAVNVNTNATVGGVTGAKSVQINYNLELIIPFVVPGKTAGSSLESRFLALGVVQAAQKVREGQPLSRSLEETRAFPDLAVEMIEVGESTGALPAMLASVAEFYEEDVQNSLTAIMSLIEPAVLIVTGIAVGGVLLSLYLPIFSLGAAGVAR